MVNSNSVLGHRSLYDRVEKLLLSFEYSDCIFTVSGKDIKAHKLILGISSPVFEAMFYGPLSSNDNICITDIEPDIFQMVLNYIYTDKVDIPTIDQAFELLYASRKYLLEHLTEICITYIKANLTVDNVIRVMNYPDYLQDQHLQSFSLELFCAHASYLLQENKTNISYSCMKMVLDSDQMNISEKDLILHVFEWTLYYCKLNNLPSNVESRRKLLLDGGIYKLLRFTSLSVKELDEINDNTNSLLLPKELDRLKQLSTETNDIKSLPRHTMTLQWNLCHRRRFRSAAPVLIDSNNHTLTVRVKSNKSVFINSLNIPTRMTPVLNFCSNIDKTYCEELSVTVEDESKNSITNNFMNTIDYDSSIGIELPEAWIMKKDQWYKITFEWPHVSGIYTYVVEYRDRFCNDHKVKFEFDDISTLPMAGGSFLEGLKYCL